MGKVETCCIKGCRHTRRNCKLRSFPAKPRQRDRWLSGIKQNFDINFDYKRWYRMCDCHFPENCFYETVGCKGQKVKRISKMAVPCKFPPLEVLESEPKQTRPPPKKQGSYTEEIDKKLAKMKAKAEATAEEPLDFTAGMNVTWQVPQLASLIGPSAVSATGMIGLPVEQQSTKGYLIPLKPCGNNIFTTSTTEEVDENQVNIQLEIISSTPIQHPVVLHPGIPNTSDARDFLAKKSGDVEDAVYLAVYDTEEKLEEFDEVDISSPLEELCRICAEDANAEGKQMIEIFGKDGRASNIPDLIMWYLPIEVSETDLLPLKVCISCVNDLERCHHMNLKCKQADATLRRLLAVEERDASPVPCVDNFCNTFQTEESLDIDVDSHSSLAGDLVTNDDEEQRILTCVHSDCDFQTHSIMKMVRHVPKVHKRYACSICWEDFEARDIRERHKIEVHEGKVLCDLCGESLWGRRGLRKHIKKHLHPCDRQFKCNICDAGYSTKFHLEKHMTRHSGERTLPCPKCNKMYLHKADVIKHLKTHVERKIFKCQQCFKSFSCKRYLVTHVAKYHVEEWSYKCTLCDFSTDSLKIIAGHLQEHGIDACNALNNCEITSPFQCECCNSYYSNKMTLRDHRIKYQGTCMVRELPPRKRLKFCPECGEPFLNLRLLNYHRRNFHGTIISRCGFAISGPNNENEVIIEVPIYRGNS